jgi:hypothetical protein
MDWRVRIGRWGGALIPGEPWMRVTLLLLLLLAAVLRFWRITELPYMHDELSALVRLYPTLWETIQRGVMELDTHPPGVQVFEWAWTRLFGLDEAVVKLPFMLMSLAAIVLVYRVAMAWTGATAALLVSALLATLQYSVLYGQLARPYAVGLFTTALFADQLTRYLAHGERRALVGMGLAAVLSAYTHHFALLLVGIMGLSGLVLVQRGQRGAYLAMAGVAALLYLPNVPIFLHQLGQGGLSEWLAPPDRWWLLDHAWWVAHCSWWLAAPLLGLLGLSLLLRFSKGPLPGPGRWLFLLWGLAPLLIGLGYSIWRAPVVQHSMLLFSFPYLVLALFMGLRDLGRTWTVFLVALLTTASTFTLVDVRKHYSLVYTSKYEGMLRAGMQAMEEHGPQNALVLFDAPPEVLDFYFRHWNLAAEDLPHLRLRGDTMSPAGLEQLLAKAPQQHVVYGESNGAPHEQVARIQAHYPVLMDRSDYAEGQVFRFARTGKGMVTPDRRRVTVACPDCPVQAGWDIHGDLPLRTAEGEAPAWDFTGREFGTAIHLLLDTLTMAPQDQLEVRAELLVPDSTRNVGLVVELKHADSTVFYRSAELDALRPLIGTEVSLIVAARRGDAQLRQGTIGAVAYLYHREKGTMGLLRMTVDLREANPVVYGITGPIDGPWNYRPE